MVESAPGGVFGGDFAASCFYILKSMDFIWVLVGYFGIGDFSVMKIVSGLFVDFAAIFILEAGYQVMEEWFNEKE